MNRNTLITMIENGTLFVRNFLAQSALPQTPGSFENWNNGDVVGHIVGWMNYSSDKLTSIKTGAPQSAEYANVTDLNAINMILYNKVKHKSIEEHETDYLRSLGAYITAVSLFSNSDISLDTFDIGFKIELWRYMLMDTVIHPIQHIMYQYLKNSEYTRLTGVIMGTASLFEAFSKGKKPYSLSEFEINRPDYQTKLAKLEKDYGSNESVSEFVRLNTIIEQININ